METPEENSSLVKNELQTKPAYEANDDESSINLGRFTRHKEKSDLNQSKNMELNQEILL